ncbi:MAG: succinate dehydrogenase assembly factor 2 [Gammaproteobacteria bacterium]|nr:MAG: succinate dehydrogenase assembly factor 2 [Gammaproteobacteria bacterium]
MNCETGEDQFVNYKWQCRRGMLELDLLLNNFVDKEVRYLTAEQKQTFELLLSYPDQTLLDLLLGNSVSSDLSIATIVQQIQTTSFD